MKKNLLSIAIVAVIGFTSCVKNTATNTVSADVQQENSKEIISNFINSKYDFLESSEKNVNLDTYFKEAGFASNLEKEFNVEKTGLTKTGVKYISHATEVTIKSSIKNSDGTESFLVQEKTTAKTNQTSAFNGEQISSVFLQEYSVTIKVENNVSKIISVRNLDKENLDLRKKEAALEAPLTEAEQNELRSLAQETEKSLVTYNRTNVYNYALAYSINPNPVYYDFSGPCSYCGGDCTNFISQCLKAGGWNQVFRRTSSPSCWWYGLRSNPAGFRSGFGGVWVSASKFGFFMKALTSRVTRVNSLSQLNVGDIVQLVKQTNGNAYHTLVVTQKSTNGDLYLSCHTSNRFNGHMSTWYELADPSAVYSGIVPDAFLFKIKNTY